MNNYFTLCNYLEISPFFNLIIAFSITSRGNMTNVLRKNVFALYNYLN